MKFEKLLIGKVEKWLVDEAKKVGAGSQSRVEP